VERTQGPEKVWEPNPSSSFASFLPFVVFLLSACRQDMHDQPRYEPLEASALFDDGRSSRPRVPGTVARGEREYDAHLQEGRVNGEMASTFPMEVTRALVERGRERYDVFCSACHDRAGTGRGIVVERGLKQPSSFHVERLRKAPPGYVFDVITRGFGAMFDLADRIPPDDRWAIVAYVRALQRSQNGTIADVPEADRARLLAEVPR
jgi:mono/diheme cytochrome c family protein